MGKSYNNFTILKLGLEMEGLGIMGEDITEINSNDVTPADLSRAIDDTHTINGGDVIVIVKNRNAFNKLKEMYIGNNILAYEDNLYEKIVNANINVLPLNAVIGMEFTNVIAYSYDMTDSQRYIAYTRATRELIVVE